MRSSLTMHSTAFSEVAAHARPELFGAVVLALPFVHVLAALSDPRLPLAEHPSPS